MKNIQPHQVRPYMTILIVTIHCFRIIAFQYLFVECELVEMMSDESGVPPNSIFVVNTNTDETVEDFDGSSIRPSVSRFLEIDENADLAVVVKVSNTPIQVSDIVLVSTLTEVRSVDSMALIFMTTDASYN